MIRILLPLFLTLCSFAVSAQQNSEELPEGKYGKFTLTEVTLAQVDGINHYDLDGKSKKYFMLFEFGKNTFNLQLIESETGATAWALWPKGLNDMKIDRKNSNSYTTIYTAKRKIVDKTESYEVRFLDRTIIVSYHETNDSDKKVIRAIMASGKF
jgi:hypothetical protein